MCQGRLRVDDCFGVVQMWATSVQVLLDIVESLLIFLGLLVAAYQIHQAAKSIDQASEHHREANVWNRKVAAQSALDRLGGAPVLSKLQSRFGYLDKRRVIPVDDIEAACSEDLELKAELFDLLNSYEKLARGVNLDIYDNTVIKTGRRGAMSKAFLSFSALISHRRITHNSPNAWKELEDLIRNWELHEPSWLSKEFGAFPFTVENH